MTELVIRNRQSLRKLQIPLLRRILLALLDKGFAASSYELGFHLVGPRRMAFLNEKFLQHTGSTDVITFDHGALKLAGADRALHGEIFICVADAIEQAGAFGTSWQEEVVRYAIHGLLHLQGYDDLETTRRRTMKARENRLFRWTAARFALAEL